MSFKPIYGYSGDHPVLDFQGVKPVCMESPNPHPMWDFVPSWVEQASYEVSAGEITVTKSDPPSSTSAWVDGDFYMVYTGQNKINFSVTYGGGAMAGHAYLWIVKPVVYPDGGLHIGAPDPTSGTLDVPYYRYRLRVYLIVNGYDSSAGIWAKLSIGFS